MLAAGLRGAQLVLLALCAFLVYAIAAPHLRAAPTVRDVRLADDLEPERAPAIDDYAGVWQQNPFGEPIAVKSASAAKRTPAVAAASKLDWKLVTTAAATPPEFSVAGLVHNRNGTRRAVRIGDELSGRKVVSIERRRVVFSFEGKVEQLAIDGSTPRSSGRAAASRAAKVKAARDRRTRTARPRLGKTLPPAAPKNMAPPPPPSSRELASVFADRLALAPGDEVLSVNGLPLDDPSLGALANDGGAVTVQIRDAEGVERNVVLEANR